ncbi:MAG: histone deacetylase [Deltaproteobacteria bacterium]|nr:MAG: histone deacetylase [Deltaproteobacteria bacterium]
MSKTAVMIDRRMAGHDPGPGHPESPARIEAIHRMLERSEYRHLERISPRPATEEEILRVHDRRLFEAVAASAGRAYTRFDPDTAACDRSFDAALLAAGGTIELADAIAGGTATSGFAFVRPPGHHAERGRAMGFCLFNNVAVVAEHLRSRWGLDRILIVDWDVHHGNGTQHAFEESAGVLYASLHQYPYYPGTGGPTEIGRGEGRGYTVNLPMAAGSGPSEYLAAFRDVLIPVARAYAPDFVLVSAGFDAHRDDPLASIGLDEQTYAAMTDALLEVARETCGGRLLAVLEGGYDLDALVRSVAAVLDRLREPGSWTVPARVEAPSLVRKAREALAPYWNL